MRQWRSHALTSAFGSSGLDVVEPWPMAEPLFELVRRPAGFVPALAGNADEHAVKHVALFRRIFIWPSAARAIDAGEIAVDDVEVAAYWPRHVAANRTGLASGSDSRAFLASDKAARYSPRLSRRMNRRLGPLVLV
jgi:hypothetical protein